jgi:hypothetical protein
VHGTRMWKRGAPGTAIGMRSGSMRWSRALPGLPHQVLGVVAAALEANAQRRDGWCGPAVVVFPADRRVARVR